MNDIVFLTLNNLRDIGGLETSDGRHIKKGMIFRSPVLYSENNSDIELLKSLNLDFIFDLRSEEEIKEVKDVLLPGCKYVKAEVFDGKKYKYIIVTRFAKLRCISLRGRKVHLLKKNKLDSYAEMPFSSAFSKVFDAMDTGSRFVFHCTEGKDRTGICAALIELILGVNESAVLNDYLLSNELRPNKNRRWLRKIGVPQVLIDDISFCEQTHKELLEISKNEVLKKYGTIDNYFSLHLGLTEDRITKWKEYYLE